MTEPFRATGSNAIYVCTGYSVADAEDDREDGTDDGGGMQHVIDQYEAAWQRHALGKYWASREQVGQPTRGDEVTVDDDLVPRYAISGPGIEKQARSLEAALTRASRSCSRALVGPQDAK